MLDLNFKRGVVKRGTKVTNEANPQITLASTYNNFKLNKKAMALLDLNGDGEDRILMMDMLNNGANGNDDRFYICKAGMEVKGVVQGSKVAESGTYSYSVIYGAMLANDVEVSEITPAGLISRDLLEENPKGGSYIATKIGTGDITPVGEDGDEFEIFDGVSVPLFLISGVEFREHTPAFREDEEVEE